MNFPNSLKKGDKVFLLCPSSPIIADEDIKKCCKVIEKLGFFPIMGKSLYENYGGYMAGNPEVRVQDLHEAFSRNDIKGIFCVKGGYSASQLLDKIDYNLIKNNPKVFVGYSDITNLHIVFNQKCNLGTYHGPMVKSNMFNDFNSYTEISLFEALEKEKWKYKEPENKKLHLLNENNLTNSSLTVKGPLIGGNLAISVSTLGTPYEIDTKGKILFLEDVDEKTGSIDRMLTHLKYSGKLDDCHGIILGNFADCSNTYKTSNDEIYELNELFNDFFKDYDKPVIYGIESGHGKPFMATLPLGSVCTINTQTKEIFFEKI
ncbi:LD-carboxypeptidase [Leptotrichia sp. OH3620_COT-345]|uniref:S66 peptidase family protein n=1 Tax=Leptotrichia sp. OH3620_COT-345 TaxID=2491048 RepID=UPI000F64A634|nr:LD-carboxypeptidase [Leptotrichia sp. OH3620_COT-345]RRD39994.1 LD-carboxypeptidase [Leptotrichia sp. OH3620_COT-345]